MWCSFRAVYFLRAFPIGFSLPDACNSNPEPRAMCFNLKPCNKCSLMNRVHRLQVRSCGRGASRRAGGPPEVLRPSRIGTGSVTGSGQRLASFVWSAGGPSAPPWPGTRAAGPIPHRRSPRWPPPRPRPRPRPRDRAPGLTRTGRRPRRRRGDGRRGAWRR